MDIYLKKKDLNKDIKCNLKTFNEPRLMINDFTIYIFFKKSKETHSIFFYNNVIGNDGFQKCNVVQDYKDQFIIHDRNDNVCITFQVDEDFPIHHMKYINVNHQYLFDQISLNLTKFHLIPFLYTMNNYFTEFYIGNMKYKQYPYIVKMYEENNKIWMIISKKLNKYQIRFYKLYPDTFSQIKKCLFKHSINIDDEDNIEMVGTVYRIWIKHDQSLESFYYNKKKKCGKKGKSIDINVNQNFSWTVYFGNLWILFRDLYTLNIYDFFNGKHRYTIELQDTYHDILQFNSKLLLLKESNDHKYLNISNYNLPKWNTQKNYLYGGSVLTKFILLFIYCCRKKIFPLNENLMFKCIIFWMKNFKILYS